MASKEKKNKFISLYYKIEGGKIKRVLPFCDRCGPGFFMADHGNRYTCGHCGFTKYKSARNLGKASNEKDYSSD
ncbi:MAG: 30S ribosomal protein S27ae [Candidatus Bathyarchaeota archaeon]|nr:30S ribosomal protein S27ae [Candidatus Bathyarchaeota archaeon]